MRWLSLVCLLVGCAHRAPTDYPMDRRSGFGVPPAEAEYISKKRHRKAQRHAVPLLQTTSVVAPRPQMPARSAPVVRRVWMTDRILEDGSWLAGTWVWVELEPARWLPEVDPGGGVFVRPAGADEVLESVLEGQ